MQFPTRGADALDDDSSEWSSNSSDEGCANSREERASTIPREEVSAIYESIERDIHELGGRVVPKMQWSCPKDASWILPNNTVQCSTPDDVFLLLKSSDRIAHDIETLHHILAHCKDSPRSPLSRAHECCEEEGAAVSGDQESDSSHENTITLDNSHVIALRKWYDLKPGREFRCFVKENVLVAVCQRDLSMMFKHLLGVSMERIADRIQSFYDDVIHEKFGLQNFVFDCYVPEAEQAAVRVIDFSPDTVDTTNPLLFSWEDIDRCFANRTEHTLDRKRPEYRYIDHDIPLKPESALYGVPFDFVDASEGSALSNLLDQARAADALE